jgi:hypothetical protein
MVIEERQLLSASIVESSTSKRKLHWNDRSEEWDSCQTKTTALEINGQLLLVLERLEASSGTSSREVRFPKKAEKRLRTNWRWLHRESRNPTPENFALTATGSNATSLPLQLEQIPKAGFSPFTRSWSKRSITGEQKYVPSNIFTFAPPALGAEEKGVSERMIILTSIFPSKSSLRWKTQSE